MATAEPHSPTDAAAARAAFLDAPIQRLTAADVAALPAELPSGPVRYELQYGVLRTMTPAGYEHGYTEFALGGELREQGQKRGFGEVVGGETGILLACDPDLLVGADVAFLTRDQLPPKRSPQGYLLTIPALVVEVRSRNDSAAYVAQKVADYLQAGVRVVWVADPPSRSLTEHRTGAEPKLYQGADQVGLDDVIPGLRIDLPSLFPA